MNNIFKKSRNGTRCLKGQKYSFKIVPLLQSYKLDLLIQCLALIQSLRLKIPFDYNCFMEAYLLYTNKKGYL